MSENYLVKLFEHNNWANLQIVKACSALSDEQLDAQPQSATKGSIRETLSHFVASQRGYLSLLTMPAEERPSGRPAFDELADSARKSGEGFVSLAEGETSLARETQLQTSDGWFVEPWVVVVQAINHATEHREQIKSMLSALGVTPPEIDGWDFGLATDALVPGEGD
jgi:uncharacterized damage-inducible protein DinB